MSDVTDIQRQMEEARAATLRLLTNVSDTDFRRQVHQDFSPVGWHLGHIGVTESYWILQQCKGEPTLSATYDHFFTPTDNPKPNRTYLPASAHIFTYLQTVRERVLAFLAHCDYKTDHPLLREAKIFKMLIQHEEQHNETMLLILHLLAAKREPSRLTSLSQPQQDAPPSLPRDMVFIPAGAFPVGSDDAVGTLDNERPQHAVLVKEFLIDQHPVTNAEFLQFVLAGGYHNPLWWTPAGWQWREQNNLVHPLYWRQLARREWIEVGLTDSRPLPPTHPVMCVSWYEADAYARFVGKRLPTEAEWEKAASWDPTLNRKRQYPWGEEEPSASLCNCNGHNSGTTPIGRYVAGRSPYGCDDMMGNVWEWTSTPFHPYPGFAAYPYEGYSVPYFDQHHWVLKGGSWATRRHVLRPTFRNWYQPWVREIFAGFRCVQDL